MAAENIYGGLAQVGQLKAQLSLGFSICLALSLCVSGGFALNSAFSDKHTATTTATIKSSSSCSSNTCPGVATYYVSGVSYTLNGQWGPSETTKIAYDPKNPGDAEQNPPSPVFGITLFAIGICVVIVGYLIYKLTMTYKPLAALSGAGALYDVGKAII
jgi:hypothetical protein